MNKTLTIAVISIIGMLTACKKDYVYTCRVQSPADTANKLTALDSTTIVDIRKEKSGEADRQCHATKEYLDREFSQYKMRTIDCKLDD